jgi:hypothetical protein
VPPGAPVSRGSSSFSVGNGAGVDIRANVLMASLDACTATRARSTRVTAIQHKGLLGKGIQGKRRLTV